MSSRRSFLGQAGLATAALVLHPLAAFGAVRTGFDIAVITDEISEDFDHACSVASREFGMKSVELRGMWGKNLLSLSDAELEEAEKILAKYALDVTDIASPLFKVDWPGAPPSAHGQKTDTFKSTETFKQQDDVLRKSIELAKQFKTDKVRGFDFWRIDDVTPFRAEIDRKLAATAEELGRQGMLFVLENEFECNTATAREAARTLKAVQTPYLALNWDPANAVMRGELDAFPVGWNLLPKNRIHHCHVKNAVMDASGKIQWAPVGTGYINWAAQFRELRLAGYKDAVSLETHWKGPGGPEASTRKSWTGMAQALAASTSR